MSYGKHSKKRLALLLANFAVIAYTFLVGKEDVKILAFFVFTIWLMAIQTWIKKEGL